MIVISSSTPPPLTSSTVLQTTLPPTTIAGVTTRTAPQVTLTTSYATLTQAVVLVTATATAGGSSGADGVDGLSTSADSGDGGADAHQRGAIAGGVVGGIFAAALLLLLGVCLARRRRRLGREKELPPGLGLSGDDDDEGYYAAGAGRGRGTHSPMGFVGMGESKEGYAESAYSYGTAAGFAGAGSGMGTVGGGGGGGGGGALYHAAPTGAGAGQQRQAGSRPLSSTTVYSTGAAPSFFSNPASYLSGLVASTFGGFGGESHPADTAGQRRQSKSDKLEQYFDPMATDARRAGSSHAHGAYRDDDEEEEHQRSRPGDGQAMALAGAGAGWHTRDGSANTALDAAGLAKHEVPQYAGLSRSSTLAYYAGADTAGANAGAFAMNATASAEVPSLGQAKRYSYPGITPSASAPLPSGSSASSHPPNGNGNGPLPALDTGASLGEMIPENIAVSSASSHRRVSSIPGSFGFALSSPARELENSGLAVGAGAGAGAEGVSRGNSINTDGSHQHQHQQNPAFAPRPPAAQRSPPPGYPMRLADASAMYSDSAAAAELAAARRNNTSPRPRGHRANSSSGSFDRFLQGAGAPHAQALMASNPSMSPSQLNQQMGLLHLHRQQMHQLGGTSSLPGSPISQPPSSWRPVSSGNSSGHGGYSPGSGAAAPPPAQQQQQHRHSGSWAPPVSRSRPTSGSFDNYPSRYTHLDLVAESKPAAPSTVPSSMTVPTLSHSPATTPTEADPMLPPQPPAADKSPHLNGDTSLDADAEETERIGKQLWRAQQGTLHVVESGSAM